MYGYNPQQAYCFGTFPSNPPPPPSGTQQQTTNQAASTNYGNTQYTYPNAASAYAQYGATASQQATAGYGQGMDNSTDYSSMFGTMSNTATAGANATPIGSGKPNSNTATGANAHYAGYEAAVYAAASSYLQAKNTGHTGHWMNNAGGVKKVGGAVNRFQNGGQKKRFGLGHQNREPQPQYYCETCKITCAGSQTYKEHLEGKAHKKKESMSKGQTVQSLPRNKVSFKCDVCNVTCTGRDTYDAHVKGAKHTKTVALLKKMNLPVPALEPTLIPPKELPTSAAGGAVKKIVGVTGTKFVGGSNLTSTGLEEIDNSGMDEALLAESNVKPVGEEFIEETRDTNGKLVQYSCKLCDCKFNDPNAKEIHLKGRRHRLQYKAKVNPELYVEVKTSGPQWKRHQRDMGYPQPMFRPPISGPLRPLFQMAPVSHAIETSDDRHAIAKNKAITPPAEDQKKTERLVTMVEKTLKSVSDQLATEETKPGVEEAAAAPDAEADRMLKGVMRVGLLAKNLLLVTDTEVDLVVLCAKIPTVALLQKVVDLFPQYIEKEESESLNVFPKPDESCFFVNLNSHPVKCRVTLTCVSVREATPADGSTTSTVLDQKPADALPVQHCLKALAELRHAKWYQVKCGPITSMTVTLRIVRDIGQRVKTWAPLSEWAMELLTEKTLGSFPAHLSPGDALRRIFEAIAGGIILNKNSKLLDPCEKEPVDVLHNLHDQEREDITSSAQHALRLIAFNQIYKILGIGRLTDVRPVMNGDRKRPRDAVSPKKEKMDE
ncbi:DZF domain-containing protein [Ditylenchus destructor]|uniref:DZF domain-containing protein n=1 Tax=Ditylenchus destructor TaxID=166010 RepID=A0AAD4N0I5_9BILA|nr:DZF domain-containing protein [Ditylenchus destructor]